MADNKDLVRRVGGYSGDEDGSYTIFDSRNPQYGAKKQDLGDSVKANRAAEIINGPSVKSSLKEDLGIWRSVKGGYASHTYGQQSIQGLQDLMNLGNSDLIVYDTEILGTAPHMRKDKYNADFYTPTEIGFKHVKMVNGQLVAQDKQLSMLLKPNKKVYDRLNGIINNLTPDAWSGMTDDMRRTLSDLTLYAGDPGSAFTTIDKNGRKITTVNHQARDLHPLKGSVLTSSDNIALMRRGLDNLREFGTTPEDAIQEMNSFMKGMQNVKFAGYNVYNFDQPMMMDYLNNQVGKHDPDSKVGKALDRLKGVMSLNQIDGLHAVRTLYRNNFSRYGLDVTLETMKKVFRMTGGQAHHALSDVGVTIEQLNRLVTSPGVKKALSGGKANKYFGQFDDATIKVGDRLFGTAGLMSKDAGDFDGVYRKKDGKLVSAYDMKANPIYRNTTYRVENFFDGVQMDGKKMWGVQLYNESDDLHHTIFRSSVEDLQNAIHGHLEHVGRADKSINKKYLHANELQNRDRATRRWRKMFSTESGGGIGLTERMYQALDIARKGEADGLGLKEIRQNIVGASEWNTDEFVRDFETMRGRLEGEEKWIRGFMDKLKDSPLAGTDTADRRVQSLALSEFGKLMDGSLGANEVERRIANNGRALSLKVDGDEKILNLTDADGIRGGLYGHLYHRSAGRPDIGTLKRRYREMLMQLKSYNAMAAKDFEGYYKAIDQIGAGDSIDNLLGELANTVKRAQETNSLNGALKTIRVEDPTKVRGGKRGRAGKIEKAHATLFDDLASQAIQGVTPYKTLLDADSVKLPIAGKALEVIEKHDNAFKAILEKNNLSPGNFKSMQASLNELVTAYTKKNMNVQIRFDGKTNGLAMVLAGKDVNHSLLDGSLSQLRKSNSVAVVNLAHLNEDGSLTRGAQNRVARLIAKRAYGPNKGAYDFVTGFDEIIGTLKGNANIVETMLRNAEVDGKKNGWGKVESHLESRARRAMQNLSMNNRFAAKDNDNKLFDTPSLGANYIRGGMVDVSDFAQEWYEGWYSQQDESRKKLWNLKTPEKILEAVQESGELFVNSMGVNARRMFQRQVDGFVNEKTGLNLGMHSAKDTHVSNYLRSNLDARSLLAFGYYNPMARENIMKTVNYLALNKDTVTDKLVAAGFDQSEIDRMTQRGVVSDTASKVLEEAQGDGKLSYLNMRAAYMDDAALKERAAALVTKYTDMAAQETNPTRKAELLSHAERLKNAESISTWDGMMLMSDEAARAFETTREKKLKLSDGATLTREAQQVLESLAGQNNIEFDLNKNMSFTKMAYLDRIPFQAEMNRNPEGVTDPNFGKNFNEKMKRTNSITVAEIVKQELVGMDGDNPIWRDHTKPDPNGVFDKWNIENMRIKGWDAENKTLVLEERVFASNTTKFISEAGHRITGTMLPAEVIRDLAGGKAHAIMPAFETSKGMHGTELSKYVGLAVDEAKAQIYADKSITAKDVAVKAALDDINDLFQKSFGINDKALSRVKDGQIIVDDLIGTSQGKKLDYTMSNVNKFLGGIDGYLGTNFKDGDTVFGNVGIGRQNVYDWENGIGLVPEHSKGLVKYGRKEIDMITTRASQVLPNGKGSAVIGWLRDHIEQAAISQNKEVRRIANGLIKTVVDDKHITPDSGDVVIRTTGNSFGDSTGRTTSNGIREVSMNAIADLPEVTVKGTKLVSDSYAQTIVDFGRVKGSFEDGTTFQEAFGKNGGTALLELPDQTFAKKYVRLVDFGDVTSGSTDTPMLREIQKLQQGIWRGIKEYQAVNGMEEKDEERLATVRGRVDTLVAQYEDKAARMVSNARDDGLMKTFGSAKMDMAGRFRIQGVNPMANYEVDGVDRKGNAIYKQGASKYQEGTVYMSRNRMAEMISGAETNIADTLGIKYNHLDVTTDKGMQQLQKEVLDNINEKGLYGFVNRYPTIKQSTVQAMKFEIDDTMASDDRGAKLTVGTAHRLKADYDGDFLSGVLTHYSSSRAKEIHRELKTIQAEEARAATRIAMEELLPDFQSDMNNAAKQMGLTAGKLAQQHNEAEQIITNNGATTDDAIKALVKNGTLTKQQHSAYNVFRNVITTRLSDVDAMETREARLGKEFVGLIDNTRDKVLNLATATMDVLEENGKIDNSVLKQYRNSIETFTAAFSQDLISAKKFSIQGEIDRLMGVAKAEGTTLTEVDAQRQAMINVDKRWEKVVDMNEAIMNPTQENIDLFKAHNKEIQLFSDEKKMGEALEMIQKVSRWNSTAGGYNNMSLRMGVSEGQGADGVRRFLTLSGDMIVPTEATQNIATWAPGEVTSNIERGHKIWERNLLANFNNVENTSQSLVDTMTNFDPNDHVLSGATVADDAAGKLSGMMGKFTPKLNGGGVMGGAVAFGAMWAASAFMRSGPTPEGLQEQTQDPAPVPKSAMQTPTARVTQNNGEFINIKVSAKAASNMSEQDVAALVHQEIGAMTTMKMDTTMNVNDNTQQIDQQWLQGVVANVVNKGFGF